MRAYYAAQHEIIDGFLEAERLLPGGDGQATGPMGAEADAKEQPGEEALILKICTLSNVVLLFMKAALAVRTGSLSLMTAALDSLRHVAEELRGVPLLRDLPPRLLALLGLPRARNPWGYI